jgi:hypothetical protein
MNPEIHSIVEDMIKRCSKQPIATSDIHTYQLAQMGHLLSLLSQEAENQSIRLSGQTDKLIKLTKAIVWFTVALFFLGFVQIFLMIFN